MWVVVVLVVLVLVVLVVAFMQFNKLRKSSVRVDEGYAQIEVQLARRADLIPNLVETVKGYASHERTVLEAVTAARVAVKSAHSVDETAAADGQLTRAVADVMVVAENYPDLKASANFLALQEELSTTENKVAFARQFYNDCVRVLNEAMVTFPSMLFVSMAGVHKRDFYEVPDPGQRNAPNVQFGP
ncbi:MAG: LemA family protein [Actinomycetes bacterium]